MSRTLFASSQPVFWLLLISDDCFEFRSFEVRGSRFEVRGIFSLTITVNTHAAKTKVYCWVQKLPYRFEFLSTCDFYCLFFKTVQKAWRRRKHYLLFLFMMMLMKMKNSLPFGMVVLKKKFNDLRTIGYTNSWGKVSTIVLCYFLALAKRCSSCTFLLK